MVSVKKLTLLVHSLLLKLKMLLSLMDLSLNFLLTINLKNLAILKLSLFVVLNKLSSSWNSFNSKNIPLQRLIIISLLFSLSIVLIFPNSFSPIPSFLIFYLIVYFSVALSSLIVSTGLSLIPILALSPLLIKLYLSNFQVIILISLINLSLKLILLKWNLFNLMNILFLNTFFPLHDFLFFYILI